MENMTGVNLSGPIIHADLRKEEFYRSVVRHLESRNIEVFAPQFLHGAKPTEIYTRDVDKVCDADLLIGEVSNPSLGVGMELMLAINVNIPILLFRHQDAKPLSRMVVGAPGKTIFEYSTVDDAINILRELDLTSLVVHPCPNCASNVAAIKEGTIFCVQCKTSSSG